MEQLSKRKKLNQIFIVIMILLFCITSFFFVFSYSTHNKDILKTSMTHEQLKLKSISDFLDEIEITVSKNRSILTEENMFYPEISETFLELLNRLETLEKKFIGINSTITGQGIIASENQEFLTEVISSISKMQQNIQDSIQFSRNSITEILSTIRLEQTEQNASFSDKIDNLSASLFYTNEKLQDYHFELTEFTNTIQKNFSDNLSDFLDVVKNAITELQGLINANTLQLNLALEKNYLLLTENMNSVYQQITSAKESIHILLSEMETNNNLDQEETLLYFDTLLSNVSLLSSNINIAHEQVEFLIAELTDTSNQKHEEMLQFLRYMEINIKSLSEERFSKIITDIEQAKVDLQSSMTEIKDELSNTIDSLDSDVMTILNQFDFNTSTQFNNIQKTMDKYQSSLINIINSSDSELMKYVKSSLNSIDQDLKEVFISVSNGKRSLASALLTKGVSCAEDATFSEIYQSILNIPQKLEIGNNEILGDITYDYHYHLDINGNNPHTEKLDKKGGCYTTPVYHVHTGNNVEGGGCYSIPITHKHTQNCYSTLKTERIITGYWFTGQGTGHACCSNAHGENWGKFRYEDNTYKNGILVSSTKGEGELGYCCNICISKKAAAKGYSTTDNSIICGLKEGLNGYDLGCGLTNSTVTSYIPSCGFNDKQITGAHIVYKKLPVTE